MNQIAKQTTTTARPSTLSQAAQARISLTFSHVVPGGRGELAEAQAPTPNERQALTTRLHDLRESMVPASRQIIETLVGSLLAGYPVGRGHRDEVDAVMKMFVQALGGLPAWAVSSACSAWNRGETDGKNASFAPAPPDLRELALKATYGFHREQRMISAILDADVIPERESDEVRASVVARVRTFAAGLGEKPKAEPVDPINPVDAYDEWEARTKANLEKEQKAGKFKISTEALRALTPMISEADYQAWLKANEAEVSTPSLTETNGREAA